MAPFLDDPVLAVIVPWFCEALKSPKSEQDYLRDMAQFWLRMKQEGIEPLQVVGDDVRRYYGAMVKAKCGSASISRYLSVIRGVYLQFAIRGLVPWDVSSDIKSISGPEVERNSTPALSQLPGQDPKLFARNGPVR
jgi:site-specific recombinase XerD